MPTGIRTQDVIISILMYVDDVDIISDSHENAQKQLDIMTKWCNTWRMIPNIKKSQVVHHIIQQRKCCTLSLLRDSKPMEYFENYKYLACWINEHGNNKKTVEALTVAAGRLYGRIVGLFKQIGDMGYHTFCILYETYILPVANYGASSRGSNLIQHLRYYNTGLICIIWELAD